MYKYSLSSHFTNIYDHETSKIIVNLEFIEINSCIKADSKIKDWSELLFKVFLSLNLSGAHWADSGILRQLHSHLYRIHLSFLPHSFSPCCPSARPQSIHTVLSVSTLWILTSNFKIVSSTFITESLIIHPVKSWIFIKE